MVLYRRVRSAMTRMCYLAMAVGVIAWSSSTTLAVVSHRLV
jgi:hypothetical protein